MADIRTAAQQALQVLENAEDQLAKPYSTDASNAITALRAALAQQAEPVQEPVAFDAAEAMRLADEYADLAADVRAAQGYPEHALAQDRKLMDEARASLEAYLSRQAEPVQRKPARWTEL